MVGVFAVKAIQETLLRSARRWFAIPGTGGGVVFAMMNVFLGGIIATFLIFEPRGLMHRWNSLKRSYRLWPFPY